MVLLQQARGLIDHHDRAVPAVSGAAVAAGELRIEVPLEFPPDVLPAALAELATAHPGTRIAEPGRDEVSLATIGADLSYDLLAACRVTPSDDDVSSAAGQIDGDGPADTAIPAGNQSGGAIQSCSHELRPFPVQMTDSVADHGLILRW